MINQESQIDKKQYPFNSNYVALNGLRYHYIDEGNKDAEPIIMVHGNPTWSFYYRNLVKDLSPSYRTIAPDHIGCGLSEKPDPNSYNFDLTDRIDDLSSFVEKLNLERKITLVVHDWGGMIALSWARNNLDKIGRLIILNTSGFHLPAEKKMPFSLNLFRNTKIGARMILNYNAFGRGASHLCVKEKPLSKAVRKSYLAPYKTPKDRHSILRFVQDIPLNPADPSYHIVTLTQKSLKRFKNIPTLILWGAKDFVFDNTFLNEWRQHMPHAEIRNYQKAGHYVLEDAYDECLAEIKAFLNKYSATS